MAFADGKVTNEEELDKYLDAEIDTEMAREADYLFTIRVRNFLMEKAGLQMPEAFLKRWLYTINEGKFSMEDIEKDFDGFLKMFTWNYIQKHFIQTYELTVSQEEVEAEAKEFAKAQFAQYGMPSAPEEMIANFSKQILENKEQAQKIYEKLYELKVVEYVKSKIKVSTKSVTSEEFAKLAQEI
jgi:trigger factor